MANIFSRLFLTEQPTINTPQISSFGNVNNHKTPEKMEYDFIPNYNPLIKYNGVFSYGLNNMFPEYINDLYTHSPLHAAIINFKTQLAVGNGYTIDDTSLDISQKIALNQLTIQYDKMLDEIGLNYFLASKIYVEVTWNDAFTKILKVESIPHEKIRVSEVNEKFQPTEYEYCYDWSNYTRFPRKKIVPFNQNDKANKCQLDVIQLKSPGQIIYNRPKYEAAINWINQDKMMAEYHQANMQNSINPSALIEFFKKPANVEEETKILTKLNQDFAGAKKAGKLMVFFNPDKDTAAKFTSMDANKLDKTFITLGDQIQKSICYAHSIDPAILGIRVSGQLGQGVTLEESFKLFNYQQIVPAQKDIENLLNKYNSINGLPCKLKFNNASALYTGAQ